MLNISDFRENLVEYACVRIRDTKTVWINDVETPMLSQALNAAPTPESFAHFFSYLPKENSCFQMENLDVNDVRTYEAERYGGHGVGPNGGGARVGNYGGFQIKGTGPNPLGDRTYSTWHSYGSLHLVDAAYEAIMSTVLNRLLPHGCVKTLGLIFTSSSGALHARGSELHPASGALLVREQSVRPAHFMRAALFSPTKPSELMPDRHRVRAVNRQLRKQFGSDNGYIKYLGTFILSAAQQFAFALAARITHGALTPSNICLDGRWIDLTETRFLPGGVNFCGQTPFYQDAQIVVQIIAELAHVYGKSNGIQFNLTPLITYYQEMFDSCFAYYSLAILGLPAAAQADAAESDEGQLVAKALRAVITNNKTPLRKIVDVPDPEDPVVAFIRTLYLGLVGIEEFPDELAAVLRRAGIACRDVTSAFVRLSSYAASIADAESCGATQRIACAIKAWRWAKLSAFFYRSRLTPHLFYLDAERSPADIGAYIAECIDNANWIFSADTDGAIPIFRTPALRLIFDTVRGAYVLDMSGTHVFTHFADCVRYLRDSEAQLVLSENFDAFDYLDSLADLLKELEREPEHRTDSQVFRAFT
jgi:hypothetical protein